MHDDWVNEWMKACQPVSLPYNKNVACNNSSIRKKPTHWLAEHFFHPYNQRWLQTPGCSHLYSIDVFFFVIVAVVLDLLLKELWVNAHNKQMTGGNHDKLNFLFSLYFSNQAVIVKYCCFLLLQNDVVNAQWYSETYSLAG